MRYMKTAFSLFAMLIISACARTAPPPIIEIKTVEVPIPVATGCIAKEGRPRPLPSLRDSIILQKWQALPPKSKAANIEAQAGRRLNYVDQLSAVTSGCN